MNIAGVGRLCTQCGACAALCPAACIRLAPDSDGNHWPQVEQSRCIECGLCLRVCSALVFGSDRALPALRLYAGHATEDSWRRRAPTGGLVTALLAHLVAAGELDGALVLANPDPQDPRGVAPVVARDAEHIRRSVGSRYCPTSPLVRLSDLRSAPPGRYAVVGLPCQVAAVRRAMEANAALAQRVSLLVGLFCAHTKTLGYTRILAHRAGLSHEALAQVHYRRDGWPGEIRLADAQGHEGRLEHTDPLVNYLWRTEAHAPARCLICGDALAQEADLAVGDAWLPEYARDPLGTNLAVARSATGQAMLQRAQDAGAVTVWPLPLARLWAAQPQARVRALAARQAARAWALGLRFPEFRRQRALLGQATLPDRVAALGAVSRWALLSARASERLLAHLPRLMFRLCNSAAWRIGRLVRRASRLD
ncbi:MAG: 4Fe-4S dicluster domain-containing protein [Chloroflexi bacterium]|nr:4Fe-4S dicluster domain-containing protein [Chloroflexota bacterium]